MTSEPTPKPTPQYRFAQKVTKAKVDIGVYDNAPFTLDQVVRATCEKGGQQFGLQYKISKCSPVTIGEALDITLRKLMEELDKIS